MIPEEDREKNRSTMSRSTIKVDTRYEIKTIRFASLLPEKNS